MLFTQKMLKLHLSRINHFFYRKSSNHHETAGIDNGCINLLRTYGCHPSEG